MDLDSDIQNFISDFYKDAWRIIIRPWKDYIFQEDL